ncbi:organic solute transporter subunit alpha-like, partial [Notechis scutatus]|uniref:Organic solute transporter subunit alpha-like n=1 Tax=Notechis scutatus TaxID=8663 RepID=A0A6J1VYZ8_9SAUR
TSEVPSSSILILRHLKLVQHLFGFLCFQVLLILVAVQSSIFSILANGGQIACSPPFSSRARGQQMHCQLLILETFVLTVLTRMYYRKPDDKPGCCLRESPEHIAEIKQ